MTSHGNGPIAVGQPLEVDAFSNPFFRARPVMAPPELEAIYSLRYQVYCIERGFLDPAAYPDEKEIDRFDPQSQHFGLYDLSDTLVGTARLICGRFEELPVYQHCQLEPGAHERMRDQPLVGEISRLALSRRYRRRAGDGYYSMPVAEADAGGATRGERLERLREQRRGHAPYILLLYREAYQAARRKGIKMVFAAMEKTLARLLASYDLGFEQIGPEVDYYGPVAPFVSDIVATERIVAERRPKMFKFMTEGLDRALIPPDLLNFDLHPSGDRPWLTAQ